MHMCRTAATSDWTSACVCGFNTASPSLRLTLTLQLLPSAPTVTFHLPPPSTPPL
jgi:hypothetical protein